MTMVSDDDMTMVSDDIVTLRSHIRIDQDVDAGVSDLPRHA
jgi:hypothetical protein